ncbi:tetratricopeptide repeat protein [Peribacillus alkalitolerans]|uniref:tetratricopeptide repeat protein n=1 Tax=Peribacillus alkalitolerans TaxID=1550385 RepID=UPI0013D6CF45|nr:tetratricopeptide repeat protein [Peribacillus alkalitolerans]
MNYKNKQKQDNVIPLPGLSQRLIKLGLDALANKNFKEAYSYLTQAIELEPDHADLHIGLVVSMVELGLYKEAKQLCKEIMHKGIGDYFQVVSIYLMVLLHLNEHEEMVSTIEALLDENEVPPEKEDSFERMLEFSKRVILERETKTEPEAQHDVSGFQLEGKTDSEQFFLLSKLSDKNIRPYVSQLKGFLVDEKAHPFLKTMALTMMVEQQYEKEISIVKFGRCMDVLPTKLPTVPEDSQFLKLLRILDNALGQENPTQYELAKSILERHHFISYPFGFPFNHEELAAAYHYLSDDYQGSETELEEMANLYGCSPEKIEEALRHLRALEEISSPII